MPGIMDLMKSNLLKASRTVPGITDLVASMVAVCDRMGKGSRKFFFFFKWQCHCGLNSPPPTLELNGSRNLSVGEKSYFLKFLFP